MKSINQICGKTNIYEFAEVNKIAIIAKVDLKSKRYEIIKMNIELESYDLFEQLVLYGNVDDLAASTENQILPRIWNQGKTKGIKR